MRKFLKGILEVLMAIGAGLLYMFKPDWLAITGAIYIGILAAAFILGAIVALTITPYTSHRFNCRVQRFFNRLTDILLLNF